MEKIHRYPMAHTHADQNHTKQTKIKKQKKKKGFTVLLLPQTTHTHTLLLNRGNVTLPPFSPSKVTASLRAPPLTAGVPRNCRSKWFAKPYKNRKTRTQNLEL